MISNKHASCIKKTKRWELIEKQMSTQTSIYYLHNSISGCLQNGIWWKKILREEYNLQRLANPDVVERIVEKFHGNIQGNLPGRESEVQTNNNGWSQLKEAMIKSTSEFLGMKKEWSRGDGSINYAKQQFIGQWKALKITRCQTKMV